MDKSFETNSQKPPIDWDRAISEFDNDREFLVQLMSNFCERYKQWHQEMQDLMDQHEEDPLRRLVHKLKGAAGNLYASPLYELAKTWEEELLEHRNENNKDFLEKCSYQVEQISQFLKVQTNWA